MVFHLLYKLVDIGSPDMFIYGSFLYLVVFSYTTLMDRNEIALWLELVKSIIALTIIFVTGGWFGIDDLIPFGSIIIAIYQVISVVAVAYLVKKETALLPVSSRS